MEVIDEKGYSRGLVKIVHFAEHVIAADEKLGDIAAGLLKGKRAACHWAFAELLPLFGATHDPARVVRDGAIITGGGVTAGIDFAFTVLAEIAGEDFAKTVQLGLEYAPAPPFASGHPDLASQAIKDRYEPLLCTQRMMKTQRMAATISGPRPLR